jgi:hypothetical protein
MSRVRRLGQPKREGEREGEREWGGGAAVPAEVSSSGCLTPASLSLSLSLPLPLSLSLSPFSSIPDKPTLLD